MDLSNKLLINIPRETAGSNTSRRYNFQKDLSLYILMQKHRTDENYVLLFDFHDDLVTVDSDTNPQNIEFYQIKVKDKNNWTINALTQRENGKLSILGKLYFNKLSFPEHTKSLNFVSNASYSFETLKDGSNSIDKTTIHGIEMSDSDTTTCNERIKAEHSLPENPEFENITTFHVTQLSNKDSSTHCIGELAKLINELNPNNKINAELAYKQVFNEINRKTDFDTTQLSISDFSRLIELKGISRDFFEKLLKSAGLYKSSEEEWEEIKNILLVQNIGYAEILKYRNAWRNMTATLLYEESNAFLTMTIKQIEAAVNQVITDENYRHLDMVQLADKILMHIEVEIYDIHFVKSLILKKLNAI